MVQLAPAPPELVIPGLRMKEAGQTVNLIGTSLREQKVANDIERGISQIIHRIEPRKGKTVELAGRAASPELVRARRRQLRALFVPPAEVDLETDGHIGIAEPFARFPVGWRDKGAEMVGKDQFMLPLLPEAQ